MKLPSVIIRCRRTYVLKRTTRDLELARVDLIYNNFPRVVLLIITYTGCPDQIGRFVNVKLLPEESISSFLFLDSSFKIFILSH